MKASKAGHIECVAVLLDMGAEINMQGKVSGVIIHFVHAMQHVIRVPRCISYAQEPYCLHTCTVYMPCCLITESSTSLDEATCMIVLKVYK